MNSGQTATWHSRSDNCDGQLHITPPRVGAPGCRSTRWPGMPPRRPVTVLFLECDPLDDLPGAVQSDESGHIIDRRTY